MLLLIKLYKYCIAIDVSKVVEVCIRTVQTFSTNMTIQS